jgi:hypothetical protein
MKFHAVQIYYKILILSPLSQNLSSSEGIKGQINETFVIILVIFLHLFFYFSLMKMRNLFQLELAFQFA